MATVRFDEQLIVVFDNPGSVEQVEAKLASTLLSRGIVKDSYSRGIAERELDYPTALMTGEVNVAIPHCDKNHANEAAVCVGILKRPVAWHRMDDPDSTCEVSLVFMLALNEAHAHLEMIKRVIGIVRNQALARRLVATDVAGAYEALKDQFV